MQPKDLSLANPNELTVNQPRAFGVLANSNAATPLASKTTSIFNCKQQEQPATNLENENQALKTQVEMLKSLLLGICKDQNISHPMLKVIDQSPSKITNEQLSQAESFKQKQKSPAKGSSNKLSKQCKENNIDFQNEKTQMTQSNTESSPSPKRRKRSDRIKSISPTKEQFTAIRKIRTSIQEMPLQIINKDQGIIEDQQENERIINQSNIEFNEDSARFENVLDQDQTHELNDNEDAQNSSQIHIKYAKMLEELENQSHQQEYNENDEVFEINVGQINVLQEQLDKTLQFGQKQSRSTHLRNKMSSQIEHKNFYELELEQLKNELEQCANEEEKLLSMLVRKDDPYVIEEIIEENTDFQISPLKPFTEQNEYSPKIRLLCIPVIDKIKETKEDESFSVISARTLQQQTPQKLKLTHEEILNNLQEEVEYLLENQDKEELGFLKPVKIDSPNNNNLSQSKFNKQYLESSGGRRTSLSSCKKVCDKVTPQKEFVVSSFDKRSPNKKHSSPTTNKSANKRFSIQRSDILPSPEASPKKKSTSSNKRNRNLMKNQFELKRIGDYSESKDDMSNRSMHELDQLAKERALAQGLQQQEEPLEDECFQALDCLNNPQIILTSRQQDNKAAKPQYIGNYFGYYSKEKSEEMKNQRIESIKKAEELLNNCSGKEQPTRPDFIYKYQNKLGQQDECESPQEKRYLSSEENIINEQVVVDIDNNIYGQIDHDISFQDHEVAAINFVKFNHSSSNESSETSSKYQSCLNIEIPITVLNPVFAHQQISSDITDSPVKNPIKVSKFQSYINKKMTNDSHKTIIESSASKGENSSLSNRSPFKHKYNQTQNLSNRRKSIGNDHQKKAQASTAILMQTMSSKQRIDNQSVLSISANQSCKPSPFKKNKNFSAKKGHPEESQQQCINNNFDAELLYQFRAKSVIKRRDEILKRKEQENKQKVQAKIEKIDQLRQSRNSRLSNQKSSKGKEQYSAVKVQEYNDNISQISVEEPRFYQSNIDALSQTDIQSQFTHSGMIQFQRQSLPSAQTNISSRLSNTSSIPTTSQLVSACTTYRKESEDPRLSSRKQSNQRTTSTSHLFKKSSSKGYNQQLINRTMRTGQSKEKLQQDLRQNTFKSQINTNNFPTAVTSLSTTLQSSKSFLIKDSVTKQQNQAEIDHKTKHNFRPSAKGLNSSRSAHKLDTKSLYSSTQRDSLGIPTEIKKICVNCERLKSKGLSTDFCLNHVESQQ